MGRSASLRGKRRNRTSTVGTPRTRGPRRTRRTPSRRSPTRRLAATYARAPSPTLASRNRKPRLFFRFRCRRSISSRRRTGLAAARARLARARRPATPRRPRARPWGRRRTVTRPPASAPARSAFGTDEAATRRRRTRRASTGHPRRRRTRACPGPEADTAFCGSRRRCFRNRSSSESLRRRRRFRRFAFCSFATTTRARASRRAP